MKKAVYRLILFAAITAFVLFLSASVKAEPNSTEPNQQVSKAATTSTTYKADKPEPAPHQKSAGSKENSQLQLAKEQLRGDFYKDDVDNLKFALNVITGLISAFIVFALATMGFLVFKNKRDYNEAVEAAKEAARDAKEAAQNAHDLEKEAQGILAQAKTTLKEIDIKAQEKLESIDKLVAGKLDEIEKTSRKQKDESSKEFERQRKINELFRKGWKTKEDKDYETAADCYRQIVEELKEENPDAYHNWGTALLDLAKSKKDPQAEELLNQAIEKYKNAIKIKPDSCDTYTNWGAALSELAKSKEGKEAEEFSNQAIEKFKKAIELKGDFYGAYNNWGLVLSGLAESKKGKEAEKLFNQAISKYKKAIEIKPDYYDAYNNWGSALLYLAQLKGGKDAEDLLKQAEEKCLKAESLKTGVGAYNLACVYALRGNKEKCKEWLKVAEKARTLLPTREHAMADEDFKSVRDKDWFTKLRWEGE